MLCQNCKINESTIHLYTNVNGNKQQIDLCQNCYQIMKTDPNNSLLGGLYNTNNQNIDPIDDFFNSWVYLGEVFRLQAKGAYWTVGTENPKNLNYGLEYLTGYNTIGSEFIPLLIMNNFSLSSPDRLNNNFFYELVLKRLNPKPINLDHLPTEEGVK